MLDFFFMLGLRSIKAVCFSSYIVTPFFFEFTTKKMTY